MFLAVISFSIYYFLREHEELLVALRRVPFFDALARFLGSLRQWLGSANQQIASAVDESWQRLRQRFSRRGLQQSWDYVNLRKMSPRQRVYFYYLALVRRGGERGLPRKAAQTPYEYSQVLSQALQQPSVLNLPASNLPSSDAPPETNLSELEQDIGALTERFVDARYSLHPVTEQDASLVRRYWQRIRKFLQAFWQDRKE